MGRKIIFPDQLDNSEAISLVEKIFPDPDTVCEGEYTTIYEFLLALNVRNDPNSIAGVLKEFCGWASYMLEEMQKLGLIDKWGNTTTGLSE